MDAMDAIDAIDAMDATTQWTIKIRALKTAPVGRKSSLKAEPLGEKTLALSIYPEPTPGL